MVIPSLTGYENQAFEPITVEHGHWSRALRCSNDGLWEWNLLTNEIWYTPSFFELPGYHNGKFLDVLECWASRIHPDDYDAAWKSIQNHIHHGEPLDVECRIPTLQKNYSWFHVRGTVYHDERSQPTYLAGSIRNIDDLKRVEKKLREQETQLQRMQKLDAVGSLVNGVAHEFNNLLQVIQGYTQFAQKSLSREGSAYMDLQKVLYATEQATRITRQLLDFSRSDEADIRPCFTDKVIQELAHLLRPLLPKNIDLQLALGARSSQVPINAQHLQQAILNLCINARDAMPEGGSLQIQTELITLSQASAELHPNLQQGKHVCLTVTDTGTGISQEIQQHIFEPFYTTKKSGAGTGLGLAITLDLIHQAGGNINCQSKKNQGTAFQIHLPLWMNSS